MVCPSGYSVMRFDRSSKRGGGVLVLYRSNLHIHRVEVSFPANPCFELICVDLYSSNSLVRFCCIYLPPASYLPACSSTTAVPLPPVQRIDAVKSLCNTVMPLILADKPVLIFGDLNLAHVVFNQQSTHLYHPTNPYWVAYDLAPIIFLLNIEIYESNFL